jgi:hypothetical protein
MAVIYKDSAKYINVGNKVITNKGYGSIIKMDKSWIKIGIGNRKDQIEQKIDSIQQYYAKFTSPMGVSYIRPVSFADYAYLSQAEDFIFAEIFITPKKFAKLTTQEEVAREHIKIFNTKSYGCHILKKLEKGGFKIVKL